MAISDLHNDVRDAADPQGRGRQYLAARLERLDGTRMAGFVMTRQAPPGRWGVATYALKQSEDQEEHKGPDARLGSSDAPYAPYADRQRAANETGSNGTLIERRPPQSTDLPASKSAA